MNIGSDTQTASSAERGTEARFQPCANDTSTARTEVRNGGAERKQPSGSRDDFGKFACISSAPRPVQGSQSSDTTTFHHIVKYIYFCFFDTDFHCNTGISVKYYIHLKV